jgi:hypothetical protein
MKSKENINQDSSISSASNSVHSGEEQPLLQSTATSHTEHKNNDNDKPPTLLYDAYDTVVLGMSIFCSTLTWVGMKTTDSALLGHQVNV